MKIKELLDNKYIITCLVVGLSYTIIVIIVGALFGKEFAGAIGGILGTIALPFFLKVRRLSFSNRFIDEREIAVSVLRTNFYNIVLSVFSFFGIANLISIVYFSVIAVLNIDLKVTSLSDALDNTFIGVSIIIISLISFFITGFIYAKTSTNTNYLGATIGAVLIIILNTFSSLFVFFYLSVDATDNREPFIEVLPVLLFWAGYIGLMLLGTYLGFRRRQFILQPDIATT